MATNKPILRKRTIQHPGFEFFETDMSIYKEYQQNTDALVVGYFAKGPILEPVALTNLSDYTVYFGIPASEAEIYAYSGIKRVIDSGGTVTAMRLPYANTTASISAGAVNVTYKVLTGKISKDPIDAKRVSDIVAAYKDGVSFKNIEFKPAKKAYTDIVNIINGNSTDDMVIINKYQDYKTENGTEYFVSILGAGNVVRYQGLNIGDVPTGGEINLYKVNNGVNDFIGEDNEKFLKVCKPNDLWQSSGEIADSGEMKSVAQVFPEKLLSYFSQLTTTLTDTAKHEALVAEVDVNTTLPTEAGDADAVTLASTVYVNYTENSQKYDIKPNDYLIAKLDKGTKIAKIDDTHYSILLPDGRYEECTVKADAATTLTFNVPANTEETQMFIDPKKDDFITVVVSKVKPSTLESGKFDIEVVESYTGSIFPNSIDSVSQESNYIGTLINENSNFISFFGSKKYTDYDKDLNAILIENQEAFGLSWAEGQKFTEEKEEKGVELVKAIVPKGEEIVWSDVVLRPALEKLKNNIKFVFRDFYDFGMSSVPLYLNTEKEYDPIQSLPYPTSSDSKIGITAWKKIQKACTQFCQYKHKLSMFHGDAPRGLVLNGTLSKIDDLREDAMNKIFTPKVTQKVSIKDSTYGQVNVQWYEIIDMFNKTKMWIPSSIILAGDITNNDINGNVWDAPAGHRYGLVTDVIRPAFNPDADLADRLYSNCLNYGNSWPTGTMTVEGQKTSYAENSALNRINVRRLMIWLERFTQNVSAGYIYEPNTASTRDNFVAELDTEFSRCKILGGLYDYKLVCDESNNSPEVIDRNELRIFIAVQPTRTVEYILSNFVIMKTGANLEEVSPVF